MLSLSDLVLRKPELEFNCFSFRLNVSKKQLLDEVRFIVPEEFAIFVKRSTKFVSESGIFYGNFSLKKQFLGHFKENTYNLISFLEFLEKNWKHWISFRTSVFGERLFDLENKKSFRFLFVERFFEIAKNDDLCFDLLNVEKEFFSFFSGLQIYDINYYFSVLKKEGE